MDYQKILFDPYQFETPAFVYDSTLLESNILLFYENVVPEAGKLLLSIKSFSILPALEAVNEAIDGFSVSSLFEARLAGLLPKNKIIHYTSPGLKKNEYREICQLCDMISFNSIPQWERMNNSGGKNCSLGFRLNPNLSFINDLRYDPCRPHSKLGIPLKQLIDRFAYKFELTKISGLHFHTNCDSRNWSNLIETLEHLKEQIPYLLRKVNWLNIGGGYLIESGKNLKMVKHYLEDYSKEFEFHIFLEPGSGLVRTSSYIISEVIDSFDQNGKRLLILDTTVNHMPEVFEYGLNPKIYSEEKNGIYNYSIYGCSCLAGDYFGDYSFSEAIKVGSRIIFSNMGAYTMVKAHMFNGINLPNIYGIGKNNNATLVNKTTFDDFCKKYGGK